MTVDICCTAVDICSNAGAHAQGAPCVGAPSPDAGAVVEAAAAAAIAEAEAELTIAAADANAAAGAGEEVGGPLRPAAAAWSAVRGSV